MPKNTQFLTKNNSLAKIEPILAKNTQLLKNYTIIAKKESIVARNKQFFPKINKFL